MNRRKYRSCIVGGQRGKMTTVAGEAHFLEEQMNPVRIKQYLDARARRHSGIKRREQNPPPRLTDLRGRSRCPVCLARVPT